MNIDYHALLPLNGKKFSGGRLTATVINIPGPQQNNNNVLYLTRFDGAEQRMLNLWIAEETLRLNPNAHRDVFKAVDEWLKTDEGHSDAPHRFFDPNQQALVGYVPGTGPVRREASVSSGDRLSLLLDGLKPTDKAAIRLAWDIQDESTRIDSLIGLAQELPASQANVIYLELMETILKAPNVQYRREKIGQLVQHLSAPLLSTLVEELKKESNEDDRNRLFDFVLLRLPLPQLQSLVSYAKTWGIQDARNLFLARLAENLADKGDVEQAFAIADTLTNVSLRDDTVKKLLPYKKKVDRVQRKSAQPTKRTASLSGESGILGSSEPRTDWSSQDTMEIASRVLADIPDEELDLLDFGVYADALAALISNEKTRKPITIGIDAAWGMGKTQLMKMVRKRLTDPVSDQLQKKVKGRSRFPTVWFNAWKYDREDALWAALVLEILDQSTKRLPSWERRYVNVRLKFRRLKWRWGLGALGLSLLTVLVPFGIWLLVRSNPTLGSILITLGVLSGAGAYPFLKAVGQQIRTLQQDLSKYIKSPDYQEKIGFLAQFEQDFGCVIDIVTETGKWPLVVFIDDLDRCGPEEAVEIVEAINILLDSRHCVFVIGMDTKAVAQSIHSKYKSLEQVYATDPSDLTLGERFLEKILQINFRIPTSQEYQVQWLIKSHLEMSKERATAASKPTGAEERRKLAEQIIQAEQRGGEKLPKATEIAVDKIVGTGAGISKEEIQEVGKELSERAFEDDERVHQAVREAAPFLEFNPRKIKKFINNFRLHALIAQRRGLLGRDGISVGLLAKAVVISMRWPDLALGMSKDGSVCETLKEAFDAQEVLRVRESSEPLNHEEILTAQDALKNALEKVSRNRTLERFIHAEELNELLNSMDEGEADSFVLCFQLPAAKRESGLG